MSSGAVCYDAGRIILQIHQLNCHILTFSPHLPVNVNSLFYIDKVVSTRARCC